MYKGEVRKLTVLTPPQPNAFMDSTTAEPDDTHMESISRPLPVSIAHRSQEGAALAGIKPCTPTQKLHHRLRQKTSNISPRRHDVDIHRARSPRLTPTSSRGLPPTSTGAKRKHIETWQIPAIDTSVSSSSPSSSSRMQNLCEEVYFPTPRIDSGYSSDPARKTPLRYSSLNRSASFSSVCITNGLYKGKRILELQDEDRRLHPDNCIAISSPSKRSKK
ncbi:uncharacterized protein PHALS_10953 [Plasmopara halstedii]|uniref:Uncharacterized protein n=1 Tax=Plasmopara halstedii TaxID=4781 RepID=A0A0P1AHM3_PLAHL|nr:uncharacterized protein PHALS_10953 [Plasmopara halstedii]CEG40769.1 hypothetical protein PHALS_10953 [Plasmopara halstedii]|eukprot:XP_024577138.1 hypothetical protein PHALS_10953 [Plasmopara halstedii]